MVGNHEVVRKGYVNTEKNQLASIGAIFTSKYRTKQLYPWPNLLTSHVVNYSDYLLIQGGEAI